MYKFGFKYMYCKIEKKGQKTQFEEQYLFA